MYDGVLLDGRVVPRDADKGRDLHLSHHLLVIGVDARAFVRAGVFFSEILDEEHNGGIARLLLRVNPKQRLSSSKQNSQKDIDIHSTGVLRHPEEFVPTVLSGLSILECIKHAKCV